MADETKKKILKKIGEAAAVVSPGAKLAKTLAELKNKKKKANFQKGDYSDIDSDETITREVESVKMPEFKRYNDSDKSKIESVEMPKFKRKDGNSVEMPKFKRKKTTEVPKYPKEFKSGGRVNFKGGGCAIRGLKKNAYGKNS